MNDANKAALAALVGITPETHPHLWQHTVWYEPIEDDWYPMWYVMENAVKFRFTGPNPLGPDADGVWLAPAVRWGCDMTTPHCYFASVEFAPQMGGGWHCHVDAYGPLPSGEREHEAFGDSMTAAYLQACQDAGVPEIIEIFGRGNHDAR